MLLGHHLYEKKSPPRLFFLFQQPSTFYSTPFPIPTIIMSLRRAGETDANLAEQMAPNAHYQNPATAADLHGDHHVSGHSHMTRTDINRPPLSMDINRGARNGPSSAAEDNVPHRFELFLLGEGEKKVTEEADTRKSATLFIYSRQLSSTWPTTPQACTESRRMLSRRQPLTHNLSHRHSFFLNLHLQQGRPHSWQPPPFPPSAVTPRPIFGLQGSSSAVQVRLYSISTASSVFTGLLT